MNKSNEELKKMANAIRFLSIDAVQTANSGHPGMPMGMADVATVLFSKFMKFNPDDPDWHDRDRFVLSAGHGSMLLYSILHLLGYEDFSLDQLRSFRQLHSKTAGHPEYGHGKGIETTTGPLGQGLANAVGMALAERVLSEKYGADLINHYTYAIAGDGCLMEGISQEAVSLAGHLGLNKLIVLFDDNSITIDGSTSLSTSENQADRFKACGWNQINCDGHDYEQIETALSMAKGSKQPTIIICKTTIGYGSPKHSGKSSAHGSPLGNDEVEATRKALGWEQAPFEVGEEIKLLWKTVAERNQSEYDKWKKNLEASENHQEFLRVMSKELKLDWNSGLNELKRKFANEKTKQATRKSSQDCINSLVKGIPEFLGGSADLTGSNLTKGTEQQPVQAKNFKGSYMYYGVREHGMAAIMNGISLHGGLIPYGGTFLVFTDYCRPAIRLSSLMKQRVIYVMTHDSIGLGEDGPTHQPVEHLSTLRAIPDLNVFRPCDGVETAEAWEAAVSDKNSPSILALSRQGLPAARDEKTLEENLTSKGAYVISDSEQAPKVTVMASGSEVRIALDAQKILTSMGIFTRVVSFPCQELFDKQSESYRNEVLGNSSLKVAVEAGIGQSWHKYIGLDGIFVGMETFGASGKAEDLYDYFEITSEKIVRLVSEKLGL